MPATLVELKTALQEKVTAIDDAVKNGVKVDGNNVEIPTEVASKVTQWKSDADEIKNLIDAGEFGQKVRDWLDAPEEAAVAPSIPAAALQSKSLGQLFTESPEFDALIKSGRLTMDSPFELKGGNIASAEYKDVFSASGSASYTRNMGPIQFDPMVPRQMRQMRVRDLFPVASTSASVIDFYRVTGYASGGGAASVAERRAADGTSDPAGTSTDVFGRKPQTSLKFASAQAPVRTIAHWEAAHRNVLADVPQLRSTIDNELQYGLRLEEDRQILNGTGEDEELLGILQTTGIQSYTPPTGGEIFSDSLRRALTKVALSYYSATGIVMHPNDFEQVELQKGSGDGQYMLVTNIAIGSGSTVWRQPVVETPAISEGTFLTGAFGLGSQLYDREQASIRISENHEDFFVRNAIVVLAEERIAIATKRPEAFTSGTLVEVTDAV